MSEPTASDVYEAACSLLGKARVEIDLLQRQVEEIATERNEAGARIVALLAEVERLTSEIRPTTAGTIDDPDPCPPSGETRGQQC